MSHAAQGLYDPAFEHDACGLGFVAHIKGTRTHDIVARALALLDNLSHRGAVGCDPCTGDGSGVLIQLPHYFLSRAFGACGVHLGEPGTYGIGMLFLPPDADARAVAEAAIERLAAEEGVRTLGWRGAFLATGAWGVVLVPLVWLTLREPPLSVHASKDTVLCDLLAIIRSRGILHYLVMYAIMGLTTTGTIMWSPSFYSRYYGMDAAQAGVAVGFILGGGSLCGSLFGGLIITRLGRKGGDRASSFMMWATFVSIPAAIGAFLVNNSAASLALLLFWTIAACLPAGHILAIVHGLVEPRHRSVAAALTLLAASIGGGIGPLLVGVISDLVGTSNRGALRIALLGTSVLNIWALIHMYALVRCSRSLGYRES